MKDESLSFQANHKIKIINILPQAFYVALHPRLNRSELLHAGT